eukprot:3865363-Pleurochrysis_carterae.AAC.2
MRLGWAWRPEAAGAHPSDRVSMPQRAPSALCGIADGRVGGLGAEPLDRHAGSIRVGDTSTVHRYGRGATSVLR